MISGLRGNITFMGAGRIRIDTGSVEYEVSVPLNTAAELEKTKEKGIAVFLHIHHHYSQEGEKLFGFLTASQRDFFAALQSVKGVGSSLALSLLSHTDASAFLEIIERKDISALTKIPRIGKNTAETLIFEIGRKIDKWKTILRDDRENKKAGTAVSFSVKEGAAEALTQLGYRESIALKAVDRFLEESGLNPENCSEADLIRGALRYL